MKKKTMRKLCLLFTGLIALAAALASCGGPKKLGAHEVHEWGPWTVSTPATCTDKGMEKRVCWIDAATETRDIPINPNAHKWEEMSAPTKTEAGTEWGACPHNNSLTRAVCISIASLRTWLSTKNINIAADPYNVALKVDDLGGASSATASLGYALRANESKYLSLDLSGSKLTGIGDKAFNDCETLAAITMPDSVTRIGASAFYGCTSLTAVTIPDSVAIIGSYAFSGCSNLASVTFEGTIEWSGFDFFYSPFDGDLRDKFYYYNGTPGTYITTAPVDWDSEWMKQ